MNKYLIRYWIKTTEYGNEFGLGIGVTAFSEEDALNIIHRKIDLQLQINSIKVIKSIEELEQNHVVPNMEEFITRGIWYPKGYR